ncbi:hypothetical protein DIO30_08475 [Campylobacter coli]|nr:hypothetical protein [Campylobacter coli]EAJ9839426.1 hypothetical protein [Campylobacter coli]EMC8705856.1 hypothetical protein [Campylobacter coli]
MEETREETPKTILSEWQEQFQDKETEIEKTLEKEKSSEELQKELEELNKLNFQEDLENQEVLKSQLDKELKLEDLPQEAKQTLEILEEKEKLDNDMRNFIELTTEYETPNEKRAFIENNLKEVRETPEINESLSILKEQDELQKEIDNTKEEMAREEKELKEQLENKEKKGLSQEEYDEKFAEMEKDHAQKLKEMEEKMEKLEQNFENSIENLLNSKSLSAILKSLYEMDKSLHLILKEKENNFDELNRQREEKLNLAMQTEKTREVVIDFIKELHQKTKGVENGISEMNKERNFYYELDKLTKNPEKMDLKETQKLQEYINYIDKETPNFKENYPKKYKQTKKIIENNIKKTMDKAKVKTANSQGMSL